MPRSLMAAAVFALMSAPAAMAYSNAANYLIEQEIDAGCDGEGGTIKPAAVFERDLTGDGNADLILSHEGIQCSGQARSSFCGAQVCSVLIYVRRGALLEPATEMLGMAVSVDGGPTPVIHMFGHGGRPASLSWDGQRFK